MTNPQLQGPTTETAGKFCPYDGFTFYSAKAHQKLPDCSWLIHGVLPASGSASIVGASGTGKSFLALDISAAVASGNDWFDRPTEQSSVLYMALEGGSGFRNRIKAWEQLNNAAYPENVMFTYPDFNLSNETQLKKLTGAIKNCIHPAPKLIIVDTLNRAAAGLDENTPKDMGKLITGINQLAKAHNALVLAIHHLGKDSSRGPRGHSSFIASLDTVILVNRTNENRGWELIKQKDADDNLSYKFSLIDQQLGLDKYGRPITSKAVLPQESVQKGAHLTAAHKLGINQHTALKVLQAAIAHEKVSNPHFQLDYDMALELVKDAMPQIQAKHKGSRAKEAIASLSERGYFQLQNSKLIPSDQATNFANAP